MGCSGLPAATYWAADDRRTAADRVTNRRTPYFRRAEIFSPLRCRSQSDQLACGVVRSDRCSGFAKRQMRFVPVVFRQRRLRSQHALIVLGAVLVLAYAASTFLSLRHAYQQTLRDATATLESITRSAETCTSHLLCEIDATVLGVDRMVGTVLSGMQWEDPAVETLLRQFDEQKLAITELLILDDKGREVNRSRSAPGRPRNYTDSAFFTAHRSGGPSNLFIGSAERSNVNGDWSIMLSRPLIRDNIVCGVIAAEVPIATFGDLFNALVTTGATRVSLILDDGILIASEPDQQQAIGRVPKFAPAVLAAVAEGPAGLLEVSGA